MQEVGSRTSYRIKYLECKEKDHEGERLNFVCLQKGCAQKSLVCSMCRHDQHVNHIIKPLKFYIQQLKQQYQQQGTKQEIQMENLERAKFQFFIKLREAVEKIADQFRTLELTVIEQFDSLQNQIRQNHSKRKLFDELYHSLTSQNSDGNPEHIMKLYLPQKKVHNVSNINQITNISNKIVKDINSLKNILIEQSAVQIDSLQSALSNISQKQVYLFPENINKSLNCFSQNHNQKDSMILLNVSLADMKGIIRFKIADLVGPAQLTLGLIKKNHFNQMNCNWVQNNNNSIMWVSSNGKAGGQNFSYLTNFCVKGAQIEGRFKKGHFKFMLKKNITDFIPTGDPKDFYVFFAMKGKLKVQILYPI